MSYNKTFFLQGATIKRIMEETDTKITVSSINEINAFNVERVITIKGESAESMSKAEAEISAKLRAAYEGDVMAPQMAMFPGHVHPAMMGLGGYVAAAPSNFPQAAALQQQRGGGGGSVGQHQMAQQTANMAAYYSNGNGAAAPPGDASGVAGAMAAMNLGRAAAGYGGLAGHGGAAASFLASQQTETCTIFIPSSSVGAVIGSKGTYIR